MTSRAEQTVVARAKERTTQILFCRFIMSRKCQFCHVKDGCYTCPRWELFFAVHHVAEHMDRYHLAISCWTNPEPIYLIFLSSVNEVQSSNTCTYGLLEVSKGSTALRTESISRFLLNKIFNKFTVTRTKNFLSIKSAAKFLFLISNKGKRWSILKNADLKHCPQPFPIVMYCTVSFKGL